MDQLERQLIIIITLNKAKSYIEQVIRIERELFQTVSTIKQLKNQKSMRKINHPLLQQILGKGGVDHINQKLNFIRANRNALPKISKIERLEELLSNSEVIIPPKYIEMYQKLPLVTEEDIALFQDFVGIHNQVLMLEKREQQLAMKRKQAILPSMIAPAAEVNDVVESTDKTPASYEAVTTQEKQYDDKSNWFYQLLQQGVSMDELLPKLPTIDQVEYYRVKTDLLELLENETTSIRELMDGCDEEETRLLFSDLLTDKIGDIEKLTRHFDEVEHPMRVELPTDSNRLFFCESVLGSPYIMSDLEDIPEEYWGEVGQLLSTLNEDKVIYSKQKHRKFNNNQSLLGTHELKSSKIRLVYCLLRNGNIAVIMVFMKKKESTDFLRRKIEIRHNACKPQLKQLEEKLSEREDLPREDSDQIYGKVLSLIQETQRGQKKFRL